MEQNISFNQLNIITDQSTAAILGNIKKIRLEKQYSQTYLASKLGLSATAYNKMELGRSKMTLSALFHISAILETDLTKILPFAYE
ncbi:MAG: helix-turn-helix transcriptional regulator [Bacteroidota bacterium]